MMRAYASGGGAAGYRRAVADQYARQYGVSTRQANAALKQMGGQRSPFAGQGRAASRTNVLSAAARAANRVRG